MANNIVFSLSVNIQDVELLSKIESSGFSSTKGLVKCVAPPGLCIRSYSFFDFINDLPNIVATISRIRDLVNPAPSGSRITTLSFADDRTLVCAASTEQQLTYTINAATTKTCQ